jgi:hypothetical protein
MTRANLDRKSVEEQLRQAEGPAGPKPDGIDTDDGRCIYLDVAEFPDLAGIPEGQEVTVTAWGVAGTTKRGKLKLVLRMVDVASKNKADMEYEELTGEPQDEEDDEEDDEDDF